MTEMEILQTTTDPIDMDMGDPVIEYSPVYPNPGGDPTGDLTKVQIQGRIFKIKDPEVHDWARAEEKPTYTKEEVGLGNVDNTSDENKPISTATQTALDDKVDKVAGKGLSEEDFTHTLKDKLDGIESGAEVNKVNSVAGKTGNVTLDKSDVGLSNVDNTSDLNKPVSTATQSALNGKVDNSTLSNYYTKTETDSALANKVDKIDGKGLSTNDYDDTAKGIVDGVTSALNGKVDKVEGYGLSENDYSDTDKAKVGEIDNKLDKTATAERTFKIVPKSTTKTSPYIYRQTPIKDTFQMKLHKLIGGSVVKNQLVDSNTTSVTIASGHRYIAKINGTLTFGTSDGSAIAVDGSRNDYFTDITAEFNTQIADYVYSLEQATAGSGISWLQSYGYFTEDYYAYTQNTIESVITSGRKVCGKNLVFETLASANITASGEVAENTSNLYDLQIAEIKSGVTYTASSGLYAFYRNKPQIGSVSYDGSRTVGSNKTFVAPITGYVAFRTDHNYATPQLEVGSTETSYEPYIEPTTYPITPLTLRGIPYLDNGELKYNGDEFNADGSVERKIGLVDFETVTLYDQSGSSTETEDCYRIVPPNCDLTATKTAITNIIGNYLQNNYGIYLRIPKQTSHSVAIGRQWFINNGCQCQYFLATPTTEESTPFTETQITGSTEEFITTSIVSVGNESEYFQECELPAFPTSNGNYKLRCTTTSSGNALSWVSE